jgi:hypothetical protein
MDENPYRVPKLLLIVVAIIGVILLLQLALVRSAPYLWPDYPAD